MKCPSTQEFSLREECVHSAPSKNPETVADEDLFIRAVEINNMRSVSSSEAGVEFEDKVIHINLLKDKNVEYVAQSACYLNIFLPFM